MLRRLKYLVSARSSVLFLQSEGRLLDYDLFGARSLINFIVHYSCRRVGLALVLESRVRLLDRVDRDLALLVDQIGVALFKRVVSIVRDVVL